MVELSSVRSTHELLARRNPVNQIRRRFHSKILASRSGREIDYFRDITAHFEQMFSVFLSPLEVSLSSNRSATSQRHFTVEAKKSGRDESGGIRTHSKK